MAAWAHWRRALARLGRWLKPRGSTASHPFDDATGMDTAGLIPLESGTYYATAPSLFRAVLARWAGDPAAYTFVDLGCGKGRVVLLASQLPFHQCLGVELDPRLAAVARANAARWTRAVCPLRIECGDATDFPLPPGNCLLYLFHPFTAEVFDRLLTRLEAAFADRPDTLDLLYVNPEFRNIVRRHPRFRLLWEMPVIMSPEDASVDLFYATDATGRQLFHNAGGCSAWRYTPTASS